MRRERLGSGSVLGYLFFEKSLQPQEAVVHSGLGRRRVAELAQGGKRQLGIGAAKDAELAQGTRQRAQAGVLLGTPYQGHLVDGGVGRAGLVRDLGVDATVDVVLVRLHAADVLDRAGAADRPHGREQAHGVVEALDVDGEVAAAAVQARADAVAREEVDEVVGEALARHGDLEVEVATRVGDEAACHERAAQEGATAAVVFQDLVRDALCQGQTAGLLVRDEDAQALEVRLELVLRGHLDQVVARLVQVGPAHGERRLEVEEVVRQADHGARDGAGLGRHADGVAPSPAERQRAAHAHDGRELRVGALGAAVVHARELVFHLSRERHARPPSPARGRGARA